VISWFQSLLSNSILYRYAKVQTALKLSEEDQSTISALKKEIEKAWKMVDASHEKEVGVGTFHSRYFASQKHQLMTPCNDAQYGPCKTI
jgi:hypothetical protein